MSWREADTVASSPPSDREAWRALALRRRPVARARADDRPDRRPTLARLAVSSPSASARPSRGSATTASPRTPAHSAAVGHHPRGRHRRRLRRGAAPTGAAVDHRRPRLPAGRRRRRLLDRPRGIGAALRAHERTRAGNRARPRGGRGASASSTDLHVRLTTDPRAVIGSPSSRQSVLEAASRRRRRVRS